MNFLLGITGGLVFPLWKEEVICRQARRGKGEVKS